MSLDAEAVAQLPHVDAVFNYLAPTPGKPRTYAYEAPSGEPQTTAHWEPHRMPVHDARRIAADLSLDEVGLRLVAQPSAVRDFDDEDELRRVYYPEAERLVAAATGAARVIVFDHTIRRRLAGVDDRTAGAPRQPVPRVHNDYTEKSGPQRVRDLMGGEADALLRRRFSIVNVWRPIRGPLLDAPLAVCDARSAAAADFVTHDLIYRDRTGEIYAVRHNPRHRWLYVSAMQRDEALLLKCYDSARDVPARFAPHSAFEDPTAPADKLPRESIELRTIAFHGG